MSTTYLLRCVPCGDDYNVGGDRRQWSSYRTDALKDVIRNREKLAQLVDVGSDAIDLFDVNHGGTYILYAAQWLAKHAGHELAVFDEYGDALDACRKEVACPTCGHSERCVLKDKHDGGCSPVKR